MITVRINNYQHIIEIYNSQPGDAVVRNGRGNFRDWHYFETPALAEKFAGIVSRRAPGFVIENRLYKVEEPVA